MDQVLWVTRRDFELSSEHDSAGAEMFMKFVQENQLTRAME